MKNEARTPSIRFAGFTDAWEQRKLGELVDRVVRKNANNESSLPLTISAQYGLVDQITYFNNRVASRDVSNYFLVLNGEFAYNKSSSDGFPFGTIKRLDLYDMGVLSTLYIVFSIKDYERLNSDFLTVYFDTNRWHKGVSERAAEGARNHGLLNISAEDFLDIDITIPQNTSEQASIGKLFEKISILITLHQRKYDQLVNIKKSMLEKMFPKNGELVPEVRFAGFTDAWEQRKLEECASYRRGSFPQPYGKKEWYDGDFAMPFVQVADVTEEMGLVENTKQKISKIAQSMSVFAEKNSVLVTLQGSIGRVAITQYEAFIDRTVLIFEKYTKKTDALFWAYVIKQKFTDEARSAPGGTIKTITKETLSSFDLHITSYAEQKKIGEIFRLIDRLITLHQRKLERLQNIKKACLEKMFV